METTTPMGASGSKVAVDKGAASAHQTVDKIAAAAGPAINRLAGSAHQTVDKVASAAVPAAEWLENSVHKLNDSGKRLLDDGKQCVRDNPLAAVGAAVAVGVLIGYMARNRH